jgi:membrane-anchored glycerophosphoryl diester phosphodiesterase (GDPDase)
MSIRSAKSNSNSLRWLFSTIMIFWLFYRELTIPIFTLSFQIPCLNVSLF